MRMNWQEAIGNQTKPKLAHEPDKPQEFVSVESRFTSQLADPFDSVEWETRNAEIKNPQTGEKVFSADDLEFPKTWSHNATALVAEKYFRHVEQEDGSKRRETSVRQMIARVVDTIANWGIKQDYFPHHPASNGSTTWEQSDPARVFRNELAYVLLNQMAAFNSPVWFNVGTRRGRMREEQCSACFIVSVQDNMASILGLADTEGKLYKGGSGSGVNYSALRSSRERLSGGGFASGPVPFIAKDDFNAGAIKSGGTTRRAAKIAILDVDHGDVLEFIRCKANSENAAQALVDSGFDGDFRARWGAYSLVPFQNANHSVRVTDAFMQAVVTDSDWDLLARDGTVLETVKARDLWDEICQAAYVCGDPGLQFDTTINKWHTCPASGRISGSNPCQPGNATVLTPDGIRTFDEIDVGSTIWSGKRWTKVAKKWATGNKEVYRFTTRAGVFLGTENHRIVEHGEKIEVENASAIDTCQGPSAVTGTRSPQAVVDGLVLGDGAMVHANQGANLYSILYVGDGDQCYFDPEHGVSEFINSKPYDVKAHRVDTTLTASDLPKTYLRKIPSTYLHADPHLVRSFLCGLYSANGSICGNRVTLKAASLDVIEGAQQMLSSIGIKSYYTVNKAHMVEFDNGVYECRESYDLNITTDRELFAELVGFIHPDKTERLRDICANTRPSGREPKTTYEIVSREFVGIEPVYDIMVEDEDHTYWTGGLLVSNCSEYMHLDDSACNLASINLLKFLRADGTFDVAGYEHTVDVLVTAMDILVDAAAYPTPKIQENATKFRQLGLGFTNLGGYLLEKAIPYDSDEARSHAAFMTAVLAGRAYARSAELARVKGPFEGYQVNKTAMDSVIDNHERCAYQLPADEPKQAWKRAVDLGRKHGYRNSQVCVIAPTGTISFMMDCDTTGIEPELSLSKTKKLVGGGTITILNTRVRNALRKLQYSYDDIDSIADYVVKNGSIVGCAGVRDTDLDIFDTSFPDPVGGRSLRPESHILMMAAVQPFVSGAISKTCNVPNEATADDISGLYMLAWEQGLKSIALYRDGSKRTQPLDVKDKRAVESQSAPEPLQIRRKLPNDCFAHRHKFSIGGHKGYIHVGLYPDGKPGEVFIKMAKEGSTVSGLMDTIGVLTSFCLQYGVPLDELVSKLSYMNFEPQGMTEHSEIRFAKSPTDYLFRYLGAEYSQHTDQPAVEEEGSAELDSAYDYGGAGSGRTVALSTGATCGHCGNPAQRAGSCLICSTCGQTTGCG